MKPQSVQRSHGQAAQVYDRLHRLHLLGEAPGTGCGGPLTGASLALSAVNLAEAAGATFPAASLVHIYLLAAIRARLCLGRRFRLVEVCNSVYTPPCSAHFSKH